MNINLKKKITKRSSFRCSFVSIGVFFFLYFLGLCDEQIARSLCDYEFTDFKMMKLQILIKITTINEKEKKLSFFFQKKHLTKIFVFSSSEYLTQSQATIRWIFRMRSTYRVLHWKYCKYSLLKEKTKIFQS